MFSANIDESGPSAKSSNNSKSIGKGNVIGRASNNGYNRQLFTTRIRKL
jgi:hypothetical protein